MSAPNGPILFNSSTGSDTAASGLGPATALSGAGASTTAASAVVTGITTTGVTAGDLLWLQSSSGRQFSIVASVDSGSQVTCDDVFDNTESSRTWAIGGKRATLMGSSRMVEFDGYYGTTLQLESGYVETGMTELNFAAFGLNSNGSFTLQGDPNYTVKPILEFNTSGRSFDIRVSSASLKNFSARNIHASSGDFVNTGGLGCLFSNLSISDPAAPFNSFNAVGNGLTGWSIVNCEIANCRSTGVSLFGTNGNIIDCWIHDCSSNGINISGGGEEGLIYGNIISSNGANAIYDSRSTGTQTGGVKIVGNVLHDNATNGYQFIDPTVANTGTVITANIFSQNGGYGVTGSGTAAGNAGQGLYADRNAFFNNTSGDLQNVNAGLNDAALTADPFSDEANGDFSLNSVAGGGAVLRASTQTVASTTFYPFNGLAECTGGGAANYNPFKSPTFR